MRSDYESKFKFKIAFRDERHEELFVTLCGLMRRLDCYRYAAAYLLALDEVVREHVEDVFDFDECVIVPAGLYCGWQTGTSRRTTCLLFNLWNGYCYADENADTVSGDYTVDAIFDYGSYAPYYVEALRLRFPSSFGEETKKPEENSVSSSFCKSDGYCLDCPYDDCPACPHWD